MGRKIEVQETVNEILVFAKQLLRPPQSCAHGTCHACHTLDTPLAVGVWFLQTLLQLSKKSS